ncbi:hypothetical protein LP420_13320 [Massilia sp. B-10]|nr:hypothetical protein LP420_13320 [Massilia sp. B-10]
MLWAQDEYRLDGSDRVLQKTPFGFDVSVWEFFLPLLAKLPSGDGASARASGPGLPGRADRHCF